MDNLAHLADFQHQQQLTLSTEQHYSQLQTYYDEKYKISWCLMGATPRPCFTPELLADLNNYHQTIKTEMIATNQTKYDYTIMASGVNNVFNLGGDLALFQKLISQQDREKLLTYGINCIKPLYQYITHLDSELTTISLVQGDALGGGFEAALSNNIVIAERGTKLGFPEVLFNLFPGMGAFSLLARKIGTVLAEKLIIEGQLHTAETLYELGIIDVLAEPGEGELAVYQYINKTNRSANHHQAMRKVKDSYQPITYQELLEIVTIWVDAALQLTSKELTMMARLSKRQTSKYSTQAATESGSHFSGSGI